MKGSFCMLLVSCLCVFAAKGWAQKTISSPSLQDAVVLQNTSRAGDSLIADTDVLYTTGGSVNFTLDAGAGYAGRGYLLLGSLSGISPGTPLPGGGVLPLNWDLLTNLMIPLLNTPFFVNFLGVLDAGGGASATFDTLGPLPPSTPPGLTLSFAFTTYNPFDFQSNPVEIDVKEPPKVIYVDDSNTTGIEDGTQAHPYNTIQEGIDAATQGEEVWVDDSGVVYSEAVVLKNGTVLLSHNWDATDGTNRASIQSADAQGVISVSADGVTGASIAGFDILPGGYLTFFTPFVHLKNCIDVSVSDCYFNGQEKPVTMVGVNVEGGSGVEIAHCHIEHLHGPDPAIPSGGESYWCIRGQGSVDLYIHNVRMNDIATNYDESGHIVDAVLLNDCEGAVLHNNLIYNIKVSSGGNGAALITGFSLKNCGNPVLYNNTVDSLDTVDNFFINQAFGYFLDGCQGAVFYNNIVTNVHASGFPPPLDRGVQGVTYPLPCDYTLTWNMTSHYFGTAYANFGCKATDPLYIAPQNGDYDLDSISEGQLGDPSIVDWDDTGQPSGDPNNPDINTRSRMGCHGGAGGETVGLLTPR